MKLNTWQTVCCDSNEALRPKRLGINSEERRISREVHTVNIIYWFFNVWHVLRIDINGWWATQKKEDVRESKKKVNWIKDALTQQSIYSCILVHWLCCMLDACINYWCYNDQWTVDGNEVSFGSFISVMTIIFRPIFTFPFDLAVECGKLFVCLGVEVWELEAVVEFQLAFG